mgnify:CR=1 FL=1
MTQYYPKFTQAYKKKRETISGNCMQWEIGLRFWIPSDSVELQKFLHKIHSYAHDCLHFPVGTLQRKRWAFSLAAHNTKTDRWSICLDIGSFTRRHFHVVKEYLIDFSVLHCLVFNINISCSLFNLFFQRNR